MAAVALVPDASVVAKWILREEDSDQALFLRDLFLADEVRFLAPELLFYEVVNVLRHHRSVKAADAEGFLETLFGYELETEPLTTAWALASMREAKRIGSTAYDAAYLVLARVRNAVMVTADAAFDRKARSRHVTTLARAYAELRP